MAASKDSTTYPFALERLVRYFVDNGDEAKPIILTFATYKEASHERFVFYSYRAALRAVSHELAAGSGAILAQLGPKHIVPVTLTYSQRDTLDVYKGMDAVLDALEGKARGKLGEIQPVSPPEPRPAESQSHDDVLNDFLLKK